MNWALSDILPFIGTHVRENRERKSRLTLSISKPMRVSLLQGLLQSRLQARAVFQFIRDPLTVRINCQYPASRAALRLIIPFQEMEQDNAKRADQLVEFAPAQILKLPGDVRNID